MRLIAQKKFNGGVNEEDYLSNLADNEVRRAINVVITKLGSLAKREGSSEYGTDAGSSSVYGIKYFKDQDGYTHELKMIGTTLVKKSGSAWTTTVKSGLTSGLYLQLSDFFVASNSASFSGTATAATAYGLTDAGSGWTVNGYRDYVIRITGGTGSGQVRTILENTAEALTVDARWDITPDTSSTFSIFARVKGLVCSNGTDTTFKVIGDGAGGLTAVDMTWVPKFKVMLVANSRLWGVTGDQKIRWSGLSNGEAFGELNYLNTGEDLESVGKAGDYIAIYSKTKTGIVFGDTPDTFIFRWRDQAHGCVAPHSVANWGGYSFALAHDGVYVFNGTQNLLASRKISPSIRAFNESLRDEAFGFVFENKYYLAHAKNSTSTSKDRIWVMDLIWSNFALVTNNAVDGVWTVFEGLNVNVLGTYDDANGIRSLYIGNSTNSKVIQLFDGTYSDSDSSINFDVQTKEFDFEVIGIFKRLGWFYYEAQAQSDPSTSQLLCNLDGYGFSEFGLVDNQLSGGEWDEALFDVAVWGGSDRIIKRLRPGGRGRTIQFEILNNNADEVVEIFKFECAAELYNYH